jgi:cell division protein FtsX
VSPEVDAAVELAIERAVAAAEKRFTATLDAHLSEFREQYRTTATCDERHKAEAALEKRVQSLELWVRWALVFSITQLIGVVLLFVGAVLTGSLHF